MDVIIVNPVAGNGKSMKYLAYVENLYTAYNRDYLVVFTNSEGALSISQYYSSQDNVENIVSIGGDETLNEIVNGMIDSKKGLIIIPGGKTNSFFRSVNNNVNSFYCDVGKANNDYFLGTLSVGLHALVDEIINKQLSNGKNDNSNIKNVLKELMDFKNMQMFYISDNITFLQRIESLSFSNTSHYAPKGEIPLVSSFRDGLFDVCIVNEMSRICETLMLIKLLLGGQESDKLVNRFQTSDCLVRFDEPTTYSFDGKTRKDKEIKLTLQPRKILINQDFREEVKRLTKHRF